MSEQKWTPAPERRLVVKSMPNGTFDIDFDEAFADGSGRVIGNVGEVNGSRDWRQNDHYARLFAAAPDLFAACEALLACDRMEPEDWPAVDAARAALKKAKGKQ